MLSDALTMLVQIHYSTTLFRTGHKVMCNLELSNSGNRLIIVIATNNRDLDSILSCYHNYLSVSVLGKKKVDNKSKDDNVEVQKTVKDQ